MSEFDKIVHRLKVWLKPRLEHLRLLGFARRIKVLLRPARLALKLMYLVMRVPVAIVWLLLATVLLVLLAPLGLIRDTAFAAEQAKWRTVGLALRVFWFLLVGRYRIPQSAAASENDLVVMLAISDLSIDPRVEREARALVARGFRVKVISPRWCPTALPPDWGPFIEFRLLPTQSAHFMEHFPYVLGAQLLGAALQEPAWAYHAHDLSTALTALLAAAYRRVPCICDFHEWYSENVSYDFVKQAYRPHPFVKRWIYRGLEVLSLRTATCVITVCDSIAEQLALMQRPRTTVQVIRNIPALREEWAAASPTDLRALLDIPATTRILLYQGGTGPTRNLEPIIRAMRYVDNAVFVIRGPSIEQFQSRYLELAHTWGTDRSVFCLPPVPSAQVVNEARAADMGVWTLLSNVGLNFRLALPNKVFEYLTAGIPLLAADLPEVRKLVTFYGIGLCFDPDDPRAIAGCINKMANDNAFRQRCRDNIVLALQDLQADREWAKFAQIYENISGTARPRFLGEQLVLEMDTVPADQDGRPRRLATRQAV